MQPAGTAGATRMPDAATLRALASRANYAAGLRNSYLFRQGKHDCPDKSFEIPALPWTLRQALRWGIRSVNQVVESFRALGSVEVWIASTVPAKSV